MVNDFLNYLEAERRFSSNTIIAYSSDLNQFFDFITNNFEKLSLNQIQSNHVRAWIAFLFSNKITAKAIRRKISSIKAFFKFLLMKGEIDNNPCLKLTSPKVPKRLPDFISENQMLSLLEANRFTDDFIGLRTRLIIEFFYNLGIRRAELMGIQIGDINFYKLELKVLGKRNKERIIPFSENMLPILNQYLAKRKAFENENDFLFISEKGLQISESAIYKCVKSHLTGLVSNNKKSPHILRHTFATHLINSGADINAVKELLGHSSLAATQVYTHNSVEKLKKVYKSAHPRS